MTAAITQTQIDYLPLIHRGKVRDIYAVNGEYLLIVATDRVSAFDVVLPTAIPGKGAILASVSDFWLQKTQSIIGNHCSTLNVREVLRAADYERLKDHVTIVLKMDNLAVEAIVRGYIAGSGWHDYLHTGSISGIALPKGLQQAERLAQPLFTPSTKADVGEHDDNIGFEQVVKTLGRDLANRLKSVSLQLYETAYRYALARGIIIADTKFEFGVNRTGDLVLIDEVLTPDSSRFWQADRYQLGISPPSFDKQIIRDYLQTLNWNKTAPGPVLPHDIIEKTVSRYRALRDRLLASD